MSLLRLLETVQSMKTLTREQNEQLESIELHLRCLVDTIGLYVECARQPDDQLRRYLSQLEVKLYGSIQEAEGGTPGVSKHAHHNGQG